MEVLTRASHISCESDPGAMSSRSRSPAKERGNLQLGQLGMNLEGSKALVTGGSRGIGFAAAELLLSLGPVGAPSWTVAILQLCDKLLG